jgi:hypothetical protein
MKVKRKPQIFNLPESMTKKLQIIARQKELGMTELLKRILERYFETEGIR